MKHTDFYTKIQEIKQQEYQELYIAVEAHGGSYQWGEDEERPIIAVNVDNSCPNPDDIVVTKIYIQDDLLKIEGEDKEFGNPVDFIPHDAFAGHLSYIIDYLPETNRISDVSLQQEQAFQTLLNISHSAYRLVESGIVDLTKINNQIIRWTEEFCRYYGNETWETLHYLETVDQFTQHKIDQFVLEHQKHKEIRF